MNSIDPTVFFAWVKDHPYLAAAFVAYWLFSNAVLRMAPPAANASNAYKNSFAILHFIAGALPRIASNGLLPPWLSKILAGGNGAPASTENPQPALPKVDAAPPKG